MRKVLLAIAVLALLAAACAPESSTSAASPEPSGSDSASMTAADCAEAHEADFFASDTLTLGVDTPSFPPWIIDNTPENGKGYEGALAYEIAARLGFDASQVTWTIVPFNNSYAPGDKEFDFDINNISITEERAEAVDFSDGYYDLPQGVLVIKGSPFQDAATVEELKDARFGAQIGTTSLQFINTVLQPSEAASVYDTTNEAKSALKQGDVDALVLDLPTAYYEANFGTPDGHLVGQFAPVHELGLLFEKGNPIVGCVNLALAEIDGDGTLQKLQDKWLADYQAVPLIG